jgi:hypothetical protein
MNKRSISYAVVGTIILIGIGMDALAAGKKPQPQPEPTYTAWVDDDPVYMVRSDRGELYIDGKECVTVWGTIQLRTVQNSDPCNGELSYWSDNPYDQHTHRFLTLDFSVPVQGTTTTSPGDLDGNGPAETIEKAPARIGFGRVQGGLAQAGILVLHVNPDGSTTQYTAWSVNYYNLAHATTSDSGAVDFSLEPGEATADLYEVHATQNPKSRGYKESYEFVGTFDLPFHIQVATQAPE